jgi:hypothetical protein
MSAATDGGNGSGDHPTGPGSEPTGHPRPGRGLVIVIVAVVIGVLLLPSATRPPLSASAVGATTPPTTTPSRSTTHGHVTTTTTTTIAVADIHVLVANATTTNGVAGRVTTFLTSKGFGTLTATNALVKVTATEIFTVGGATGDTSAVAAVLGLAPSSIEPPAQAAPVSSTTGANVVVIVGPDLASRFTAAAG